MQHQRIRFNERRHGSVLLVVLVLVMMLSLGAYAYTELMVTELGTANTFGRRVVTRTAADSGIEYVASIIDNRLLDGTDNLYHDPDVFRSVVLMDAESAREIARFSMIAPYEYDQEFQQVRYGLINESSRINLNTLIEDDESQASSSSSSSSGSSSSSSSSSGSSSSSQGSDSNEDASLDDELTDPEVDQRERLMALPNMTEEIADAILDWLDEDDDERTYGAESQYYESLSPSYFADNGPLASLEDMLKIRGVTVELLFGEDTNRNGLLDPNEDDGPDSVPVDNADGVLDLGWAAYLTVYSRESNLRIDGTSKINLNQDLLTELFDELELELGEEMAQFIVAFRMYGSQDATQNTTGDELSNTTQEVIQEGVKAAIGAEGSITRAGLDLSQGSKYLLTSIYDLVDAEVEAQIDGRTTKLISPWTSDPSALEEYLPTLVDTLSLTDAEFLEGRVDINQARGAVLMSIPGIDQTLVDSIVAAAATGSNGQPSAEVKASRVTSGWLLIEGLVDLPTMRELDPYITTRGDVYRTQIVGYFDGGGPTTRVETVVDGSVMPAKPIFSRDLTPLGRGYARHYLDAGEE